MASKTKEFPKWCEVLTSNPVKSIGEYLKILDGLLNSEHKYWFRGHRDIRWELRPSALRPKLPKQRRAALNMLQEFKRQAIRKIPSPPETNDDLHWLGVAQHYGLPTRLLDWSENPMVALYFGSLPTTENQDGGIFVLKPEELNRESSIGETRILDSSNDARELAKYLGLDEKENKAGKKTTLAINPMHITDRILLQKGTFTLHGNKKFSLDKTQAPSLVCLPIPFKTKTKLVKELDLIGVNESTIFPEPEYLTRYLCRSNGLGGI